MLDGDPYGFFKRYRILNMEPIEACLPTPVVSSSQRDPMVQRRVLLLGTPSSIEVILGAGAVEGRRPLLPINENHVVPLPVPVPLVRITQVVHVQNATDVVPLAFGFEDGVVALTTYVLAS